MNCLLYARVSTDKQAQKELSIPAQLSAMRSFVRGKGWRVIGEHVDEGHSARSMNRPQLQQLIRFCKEKKGVDAVVVHKLDRMARNLPDYIAIKTELKRKGIRLVSVVENFEDSVTGRLLENIMASISEWYSGNLGEEIKKAALAKLQRGEWPTKPPIGYRSERNEEKKVHHLNDPVSGPLVQQAFQLYATGDYSLEALSEEMAGRGLLTRNGKALSQEKIKKILSNPFYIGTLRWKDKEYPGKHKPLIEGGLFYRVQDVLAQRHIDTGTKGKLKFLLRGIAYCGTCGQKLTAEAHLRGNYYRCLTYGAPKKCDEPYAPAADLEKQLVAIYRALRPPESVLELLKESIMAIAKRREEIAQKEMGSLQNQLSQVEARELRLGEQLLAETLNKETYQKLAKKLQEQRRQAEARLAQMKVDYRDPLDFFDKAAFTSSFLYTLHRRFKYEQRKVLLRAVFHRIYVQDRRIIGYELNPPFSFFLKSGSSTMFKDHPLGAT